MCELPLWLYAWLLAFTAAAAVMDARTGMIPDWLTLSTLLAAPLVHAAIAGSAALGMAFGAALLCATAPLLLFCARAMGGGDVKLFAAVGALCGVRFGLEVQLASYALALLYGCGALCWRGQLLATLRSTARIALAAFACATPPAPEALTAIRLGPAVFCASACLIARAVLEARP